MVKNDPEGSDPGKIVPVDGSEQNPLATHRRRLIRILALSGGGAVGAVMSSRWETPVIESVLLPAHAQTTVVSAVPCLINIAATVDSGDIFTLALAISSQSGGTPTTLASTTGDDELISLADTVTLPPGDYEAFFRLTHPNSGYSYTFAATCCNDNVSFSSEIVGAGSTGAGNTLTLSSGDCAFD